MKGGQTRTLPDGHHDVVAFVNRPKCFSKCIVVWTKENMLWNELTLPNGTRGVPSGVIALRVLGRLNVMVAIPWDISTFTPGCIFPLNSSFVR